MSHATLEQSDLSSQQKNQSSTWNHPVPLTHVLNNETPYPFDALPNTLQQVVNAYQCYGQQPLPLVASGALANLPLAPAKPLLMLPVTATWLALCHCIFWLLQARVNAKVLLIMLFQSHPPMGSSRA